MNGSGFTETPTESPSSKTLSSYIHRLDRFPEMHREGKVLQVIGHMVEATNPGCSVGGMCTIYNPADDSRAAAGTDSVNIAEGHDQHPVFAETDYFCCSP